MEPPPPVIQPLPQDKKSLIRHLERNCPETLALARDWDDTARSLTKTHQKIARCVLHFETQFAFPEIFQVGIRRTRCPQPWNDPFTLSQVEF